MRTLAVILDVVTGLLLFSTIICGVWIKTGPKAEAGSVGFHLGIALLTAAFVVASGELPLRYGRGAGSSGRRK